MTHPLDEDDGIAIVRMNRFIANLPDGHVIHDHALVEPSLSQSLNCKS